MVYHCRKCNPYSPGDYREEILQHFRPEQPEEAKALLCGFSEAILKYSFENAADEPGESEPESVLTAEQVMYRRWAVSCVTMWSSSLAIAHSYLFALKLTEGRPFPGPDLRLADFMWGTSTGIMFYYCACQQRSTLAFQNMINDVHGGNRWVKGVYESYSVKRQIRWLAKSLPESLQIFTERPELF